MFCGDIEEISQQRIMVIATLYYYMKIRHRLLQCKEEIQFVFLFPHAHSITSLILDMVRRKKGELAKEGKAEEWLQFISVIYSWQLSPPHIHGPLGNSKCHPNSVIYFWPHLFMSRHCLTFIRLCDPR